MTGNLLHPGLSHVTIISPPLLYISSLPFRNFSQNPARQKMDVDKNDWELLRKAIDTWAGEGRLDEAKAEELRQTVQLKKTERHQIAQYFFIVAISCIILAFGAIFIDEKFLEKLKTYFALSNLVIALGCATVGALWFWYVRKRVQNLGSFSYEAYMVLGALLCLSSLVYICKDFGFGPERTVFFALSAALLFSISVVFRSRVLWLAGLASVVCLFSAFTTWQSSRNLFLGMNYPTRFVLLGLIITGISFYVHRSRQLIFIQRLTYLSGLLLFLFSMWMVSIFGNYGYLDEWSRVRQTQVIFYGVLFGLVSALVFNLGIRHRDNTTRDLAVLFLLLNLYSRYFEYFWDNTNKGLFFLVLAVSFWFIGRWIERRKRGTKSDTTT